MNGIDAITRVLPHRYPMLLVDRVVEVEPGLRLVARKAVSANEPWYRDLPASYPPVLLVESWCQAAGLLGAWQTPNPNVLTGQVMLVGGLTGIRFGGPVVPGDVVEHRVRLDRVLGDTMIFEGESLVDDRTVLEVTQAIVTMRPAATLASGSAGVPA